MQTARSKTDIEIGRLVCGNVTTIQMIAMPTPAYTSRALARVPFLPGTQAQTGMKQFAPVKV